MTTARADAQEQVVVVDRTDQELAVAPKWDVHRWPGVLHRAVSAWLVDAGGRVLLQRRSLAKYHFAGRWSNACCTHPRPGEASRDAIARRVREELGVAVDLEPAGSFEYRAEDPESSLVEHELDHVFVGIVSGTVVPNPAEVMAVAFMDVDTLRHRLRAAGPNGPYTPWLVDVMAVATTKLPIRVT